jgi:hypothetical protein
MIILLNTNLYLTTLEIDNDYLYHDRVGHYISHIHTLRVLNEYYTKYKNLSHFVDIDKLKEN